MQARLEKYCGIIERNLNFISNIASIISLLCSKRLRLLLDLGVSPDRILYSSTDKPPSYLQYASLNKVHVMTVDSESELNKIKKYHPSAQ